MSTWAVLITYYAAAWPVADLVVLLLAALGACEGAIKAGRGRVVRPRG